MRPDTEGLARLRWLVQLRWYALTGVSLAALFAGAGFVPGVNLSVVGAAVLLGVLYNAWLTWRGYQLGETDARHIFQATFDTGALTLVLWGAGGGECPFVAFYVFPVLLAALLGGGRALWPTGFACFVGLCWQIAAVRYPPLRVGRWDPIAPWDTVLGPAAVALTVASVAYFAYVFAQALQRRRVADILAQRKLLMTERLASLGRTVQGVAHELNTPLATIQTLGRDVLDAIADERVPPALHADLSESAEMIVAEVGRCRNITHALLGRAGALDLGARGEAPVSAAVERAVAVVFPHERTRVETDLGEVERSLPLEPVVQILVNLLQNAADADPEGRIEVRASNQPFVLEVRDHGAGVDPSVTDSLFEPFVTTKPPGQGTGLGLYASYALARSLGAELSLSDHPQGGAVARLSFNAPSTPAGASG